MHAYTYTRTHTRARARALTHTHTHTHTHAQGAMNEALEIMRRDRKWNDDGGRKLLVRVCAGGGERGVDI